MEKKKVFFLWLIVMVVFLATSVSAKNVSYQRAEFVAQKWLERVGDNRQIEEGIVLRDESGFRTGYLFNLIDGGFVVVPTDDVFEPIKAWSRNGSFYGNPNYAMDMATMVNRDFRRQRHFLKWKSGQQSRAPTTDSSWELLETSVSPEVPQTQVVGPLLTTMWGQDEPYSNYCPVDISTGYNSATGCVATAIAQIMNYWEWPKMGQGSNCYFDEPASSSYYSCGTSQELCSDFSKHQYDWDNMLDYYPFPDRGTDEEDAAVALLMSDVGIAVGMCYSYDGSAAYSHIAKEALIKHFGYSEEVEYISEYRDNFFPTIKEQLDKRLPVYFSSDHHAYVADGYLIDIGINQVHYNFGWTGGSKNGWYTLEDLNEFWNYSSEDGYPYVSLIINIYPLTSPPKAPVFELNVNGSNVSCSWSSNDADGYIMSVAPYPFKEGDSIVSADLGQQTSLSAELPSGAAYYVAVQAYNQYGVSEYSNLGSFVIP